MIKRVASITLFLVLTLAGSARAQQGGELPTVAVLDFTGFLLGEAANSEALGKAVSSMLITELSGRDGLRVIERYRLQDILTEQSLSLSGRVDEGSAVGIGQMVGAQYIIHGQITGVGEEIRMDIRAVNVETSQVMEVHKLTSQMNRLLAAVVEVADEFGGQLNLAPPTARTETTTIPVGATIEFSRGLDMEDQGNMEQALTHYHRALEIFPDHRDARAAVNRLAGQEEDR